MTRTPPKEVVRSRGPFVYGETLHVREAGREYALEVEEICLVLAEGNYTHIHLRSGEKLFLTQGIGAWEEALPSVLFVRLDRSILVNLFHISKVETFCRDRTLLHVEAVPCPIELGRVGALRLRGVLDRLNRA